MLYQLSDYLAGVLGFQPATAEILSFFIYDTVKILIMLALIIFVVSVIRSFLPPEKIRFLLSRKKGIYGNFIAGITGIFTPFCSCSAVPLFLGFVRAGAPLGAVFSFLVASPMINEVALVLLLSLFGWKIALIYIASGLVIAVLSGLVIGRLKVENLIEPFTNENSIDRGYSPEMGWPDRLSYARNYTWEIISRVWLYVVIGVGLGALIHGYLPADFLAKYAAAGKWYAVPLAVLIGVPLYSNAAGIIPLIGVLTEKGMALGTALALMMSVTALSLPEFIILKRVMKARLIVIFAAVVAAGIILTGYLFNWLIV